MRGFGRISQTFGDFHLNFWPSSRSWSRASIEKIVLNKIDFLEWFLDFRRPGTSVCLRQLCTEPDAPHRLQVVLTSSFGAPKALNLVDLLLCPLDFPPSHAHISSHQGVYLLPKHDLSVVEHQDVSSRDTLWRLPLMAWGLQKPNLFHLILTTF